MKQQSNARVKEIAEKRIRKLFEIAKEEARKRPALAKRYIKLARELARKTQTKIPPELKKAFCKKCMTPFTGSSKARTRKGFLVYTCAKCGERRRFKISNKISSS